MTTTTEVTTSLNGLVADGAIFYQKLRNYHWNIKGRRFFELHTKFEELYDEWSLVVDALAERVLTLGERPFSTLQEFVEFSRLQEGREIPEPEVMVEHLIADLDYFLLQFAATAELAESAGDRGTISMMDGLFEEQQKNLWMLRTWLA